MRPSRKGQSTAAAAGGYRRTYLTPTACASRLWCGVGVQRRHRARRAQPGVDRAQLARRRAIVRRRDVARQLRHLLTPESIDTDVRLAHTAELGRAAHRRRVERASSGTTLAHDVMQNRGSRACRMREHMPCHVVTGVMAGQAPLCLGQRRFQSGLTCANRSCWARYPRGAARVG